MLVQVAIFDERPARRPSSPFPPVLSDNDEGIPLVADKINNPSPDSICVRP